MAHTANRQRATSSPDFLNGYKRGYQRSVPRRRLHPSWPRHLRSSLNGRWIERYGTAGARHPSAIRPRHVTANDAGCQPNFATCAAQCSVKSTGSPNASNVRRSAINAASREVGFVTKWVVGGA